jgi:hypothetical protein
MIKRTHAETDTEYVFICVPTPVLKTFFTLFIFAAFVKTVCAPANPHIFHNMGTNPPIPVAVRSKAWAFGRALAGIVVSNPAGGMDICLL